MPRVIGVDPGSLSFDLCGLDDNGVFLDISIPAADAARSPALLVEHLTAELPVDLIAAPSGYGLPLVPVAEITDDQLDLSILVREDDRAQPEMVGGLRAMIELMRERRLPAVVLPGVIHLPTVPAHRKVNRIDMGTADKLCVAALGIRDQASRLGLPPDATSFVLIELGGAFTAGLAVDQGRIVDGIGGTGGGLGYRALGTFDGEVGYALGRVHKAELFAGGAAFIAGDPSLSPESFAELAAPSVDAALNAAAASNATPTSNAPTPASNATPASNTTATPSAAAASATAASNAGAPKLAWAALLESIEKMVAALRVSVPEPREVLLSGRLSRVPSIAEAVAARVKRVAPVRTVTGFASRCKEAAQGAALIADGLAGGPNRAVVDVMRLREARGTILDHLYLAGRDSIRRQFGM
jgi:predicted butyrate kinase (DUF1464 family)